MRYKTAEAVKEQLKAGVIEQATSEWAGPVVFVPKLYVTMLICVDYRPLNQVTIGDMYPLPRMDDYVDSLGNTMVFSTSDANFG